MPQAKVWNDGPSEYKENFNGEPIAIPQGGHVVMDSFDAHAFCSSAIPIKKDGVGNYLNHKKLRVEVIPDAAAAPAPVHQCMMCRGKFDTATELALHSESLHKESIVQDKPQRARA